MIAEEAYVLSKSFTNNSLKGITGALAGKNCTIKSATKADGVTTVVFAWTADDGTEKTTTIQVNDGTDDYEDLINRPKIEGVDLIGNKTFEDLGVASATDLAQTDGHLQDLTDLVGDKVNLPMPNETVVDNIEYVDTKIDGLMGDIGQLKGDLAEITEKHETAITADLFEWGIVDSNGIVTQDTETTLRNIYSEIISIKGAVITPLQSNTIFKVVYYSENGSYISSTPWMGLSSFTIVESYTVDSDYCRICIADATQDVGTTEISQHLAKYSFRGNTEKFVNGDKIAFHNNEIEEKISLPFSGFRIEPKLYKQNGKYYSKINPRDNFIKKDNGVVVYWSPNGSHDADGLTVITPVKTLAEALAVENVNTIICLEGTYVSGTNYSDNQIVTKEVNIIGLCNVVFDNATNHCIRFYRSVYCENIHFKGGDTTVACELATYDRKATFYKCTFSESVANNGLAVFGGIAYVIDCIAFGNAFDGFNYHAKETVVNHSIEINCVSYGNGTKRLTESDGQSSNATTSHDGSYIVRINGNYQCCHGGVVADKECKSANYACSSGVSTVTDEAYPDRMSNYWSSNADMYLYDCISYGSKYDTAIINGGTITSNVEYASNYLS